MKRSRSYIVVILAVAVVFLAFATASQTPASPSYVLPQTRGELPDAQLTWLVPTISVPAALPVYDIVDEPVSARDAADIAASLGMTDLSLTFDESREAHYVRDAQTGHALIVHAGGGFIYWMHPDRTFDTIHEGETAPTLPSPEQGYIDARDFLARVGIQPSGALLDAPSHTWDVQGTVNTETGEHEEFNTNLEVRFARAVDGRLALGPGAKLYVHFADGGEIVGLTMSWPNLVAAHDAASKPLSVAIAEATLGESVWTDMSPTCVTATMTGVEVKIWIQEADQEVAFPVYDFTGTCALEEGGTAPVRIAVPAVS